MERVMEQLAVGALEEAALGGDRPRWEREPTWPASAAVAAVAVVAVVDSLELASTRNSPTEMATEQRQQE